VASEGHLGGSAHSLTSLPERFFGWWFGELASFIPGTLRRLLAGHRRRLHLLLRNDVTDIYEERGGPPRPLTSLELDPSEPALRALQQRLQEKGSWAEILIVIPSERALHRRLHLPAAMAENLRESVGFDIDRLTPFKAGEVVYQVRLAGTDRQRSQILCDLTVVPRTTVDAALHRASALGIRPDRIAVEPPEREALGEEDAGQSPIYLPVAFGGRIDRWLPWRLPLALAGLALLLAATSLILHFDANDAVLAAYAAETAKYRAAAEAAGKLREQVMGIARTQAQAATQRQALPLMVDVLAELTAKLPDDTWLTDLRISNGHLQMTGYANSAAALVPVIEDSPMFQSARLSGPVLPDPTMHRERFSIEADLTPKGAS
jgi:general secretion pathway protein L